MLFLPNDDALEAQAKAIIDEVVSAEGLKVLGYRQVPVDHAVVGRFAKDTQPRIWQVRTGHCGLGLGWGLALEALGVAA
jgi:glutamate synthase domain-containing protein 1